MFIGYGIVSAIIMVMIPYMLIGMLWRVSNIPSIIRSFTCELFNVRKRRFSQDKGNV